MVTDPNAPAWETQHGNWGYRLFDTAVVSSLEAERFFGRIPDGRVVPALQFAVLAEAISLGSFGVVGALAIYTVAPDLALRLFTDGTVAGLAAAALVIAVGVMVGLHAIWGFCLVRGASDGRSAAAERGSGPVERVRTVSRGLRFGLYACGWDLLTSPAGFGHAVWTRHPVTLWEPLAHAIRAPRAAMRAFLASTQLLDTRAERRVLLRTLFVLGALLLALFGALAALLVLVGVEYL